MPGALPPHGMLKKNKSITLLALAIAGLAVAGMGSLKASAMDIWGKDEVPEVVEKFVQPEATN
jgi:hypothetical protein